MQIALRASSIQLTKNYELKCACGLQQLRQQFDIGCTDYAVVSLCPTWQVHYMQMMCPCGMEVSIAEVLTLPAGIWRDEPSRAS